MRQKILFTITLFFLLSFTKPLLAGEPQISAQSAILVDGDTGAILYSRNPNQQRPPASLTKILTTILAIEKGNLEDVVEISKRAAQTGEARLNLLAGEKITLENLLYGALLKSGNDACVAIAENVSPTVEEFVALMNLKAQLLGCYNTHFENTNGLPAKNHYSTALDLALIARYALENPTFTKIVSTPVYTVNWEESGRKKKLKNTNRLLTTYPGATGIKTGTTIKAGQCLVASATRENRNLIAVILKSNNRFYDAKVLLDYGFANFRNIDIIGQNKIIKHNLGNKELVLITGKPLTITVNNTEKLNITQEVEVDTSLLNKSIKKHQFMGYITYFNNGLEIGKVPLLSVQGVTVKEKGYLNFKNIWQQLKGKSTGKAN
ncbi:MAG: hypothetical protein PWQ67_1718 [Clostridia bacterium]|jgi:D-alanyl-D-alanine carboxypeptidase (penicillin-binding protein 5/6)|nr:hypothetical protein [Clostridia bacterium]MDN5323264.1 hypothetical protein [Clostridia bacterium]